jgi:hypothetical protein
MNPPEEQDAALPALTLGQRLLLVWVWFFRGIADGRLAARLRRAQLEFDQAEGRALPSAERPSLPAAHKGGAGLPAAPEAPAAQDREAERTALTRARAQAAFALLGLLQREGRLVDFVQQDISAFSDADIGAAARLVHAGCRKALAEHVRIRPVVEQAEGSSLRIESGYDPMAYKLTGNVSGSAPYTGVLRHKGWRAELLELPEAVAGVDDSVLMPAEVEL